MARISHSFRPVNLPDAEERHTVDKHFTGDFAFSFVPSKLDSFLSAFQEFLLFF